MEDHPTSLSNLKVIQSNLRIILPNKMHIDKLGDEELNNKRRKRGGISKQQRRRRKFGGEDFYISIILLN